MEAGADQRYREDLTVSARAGVRKSGETHCDACRFGVRRHRREISGDGDGVVRADYCRSAQSQRAGADFDGAELLEILESCAGEDLIGWRSCEDLTVSARAGVRKSGETH